MALTIPRPSVDSRSLVDTLGERIREARLQKRWSQRRLADAAGFGDAQSVSKYERDVHEPNLARLEAIARALGKPMSYFVDEPEAQEDLRAAVERLTGLVQDLLERLPPPPGSPSGPPTEGS